MRIVEQALREIPLGSISLEDPRVVIPEKEKVYNSIEGLMHHFKIIMEGIQVPPGEVYSDHSLRTLRQRTGSRRSTHNQSIRKPAASCTMARTLPTWSGALLRMWTRF
jgi:hypothetical protein